MIHNKTLLLLLFILPEMNSYSACKYFYVRSLTEVHVQFGSLLLFLVVVRDMLRRSMERRKTLGVKTVGCVGVHRKNCLRRNQKNGVKIYCYS